MLKSSQLTITVTPDIDDFIREQVASGRFDTPGDVVREGLRLLGEKEHDRDVVLDGLRREIEIGLEQAKAAQLRQGRAAFEELRRKVRMA